jgi:predicted amidophosphoribosyltransferase
MGIPHWLLRLFPMWDYICPRCKKKVQKKSHNCPHCQERYSTPVRVPPKLCKDKKALENYVHKHVFPKVSYAQRNYLTQFFTTSSATVLKAVTSAPGLEQAAFQPLQTTHTMKHTV